MTETQTDSVEPAHIDNVGPLHPARYAAAKLALVAVGIFALLNLLGWVLTHVLHPDRGIDSFDGAADRDLANARTGWLVRTTYWITQAAQTRTVIVVAALVIVALLVASRRWQEPVFVGVTLAGEVIIFLLTTLVVHRHRPEVMQLDPAPPTSSFPSGHTAASVAMYGSLAVVVWKTNWRRALRVVLMTVLLLLPIAVGLSRIYRGMHYPTDVLGGIVLGVLWLRATSVLLWPGRP